MLALHLMLFSTYYAQNYDGIIGSGLNRQLLQGRGGILLLSDDFCYAYMHGFIQSESQVLHSVVPGLHCRLTISPAIQQNKNKWSVCHIVEAQPVIVIQVRQTKMSMFLIMDIMQNFTMKSPSKSQNKHSQILGEIKSLPIMIFICILMFKCLHV